MQNEYKYEHIKKEEIIQKMIKDLESDHYADSLTERWINTLHGKNLNKLGEIQNKLKGQKQLLEYLKDLYAKKEY